MERDLGGCAKEAIFEMRVETIVWVETTKVVVGGSTFSSSPAAGAWCIAGVTEPSPLPLSLHLKQQSCLYQISAVLGPLFLSCVFLCEFLWFLHG